jgi:hypothetical protein
MQQYPRMLYRPGQGEGEMVWNHRIDTFTVKSAEEERAALRRGWHADPQAAIKRVTWYNKLRAVRAFYLQNWQWLWGTAIAIGLAVAFGNKS